MRYRELLPCRRLAPWIKCFWILENPAPTQGRVERIVPDGCPELIVHYGDRFAELASDRRAVPQPRVIFAGQLTRPLQVQPTGRVGMIAARFHAAGAYSLLGVPMQQLVDCRLPLDAVAQCDAAALEARIAEAPTDRERLAALESFLIERSPEQKSELDQVIDRCLVAITARQGRISLDDMARLAKVSSRQLERRFLASVGISPKLLCRIVRFRGIFEALEQRTAWSIAAVRCGYFDQAHLIRDFRAFTGQPPTAYFAQQTEFAQCLTGRGAAT